MSGKTRLRLAGAFRNNKDLVYITVLIILFCLLSFQGLFSNQAVGTDQSRHALDGIFYHDLISDIFTGKFAGTSLYDYVAVYFARYPALGLLWWPPVFPVFESLFYFIFGINLASAKLTIIFFGIVAVIFWYKLVRLAFRKSRNRSEIAFFSGILFISTPIIYRLSRQIMLEFPAMSMMLVSVYFFYRFMLKRPSGLKGGFKGNYEIYLAALFWLLAMLIKSELLFVGGIYLLYILVTGRYHLFLSKQVIMAFILVVLFVSPWLIFALNFQPARLDESIGTYMGSSRWSFSNWFEYAELLPQQLSWFLLILSVLAILYLLCTRRLRELSLFWIWLVVVYFFFSYVSMKGIRYNLYYLPIFTLFIVLSFFDMKKLHGVKFLSLRLTYLILIIICAISFTSAYIARDVPENTYAEAARFVMEDRQGGSIFFLGSLNGDFVYHIRLLDLKREMFVLRGSIYLTSFDIYTTWGSQDYIDDEQKIYDFFDEMGVYYVVVEEPVPFVDPSKNNSKYPVFNMFEKMLETGNFTRIKSYDVESTDWKLNVYKYNRYKPTTADNITIPLYAIGRDVTVSLK